jgi:hypothetical protein
MTTSTDNTRRKPMGEVRPYNRTRDFWGLRGPTRASPHAKPTVWLAERPEKRRIRPAVTRKTTRIWGILAKIAHGIVAAFVGVVLLLAADKLSAKTFPPVIRPNTPLQHYCTVAAARRHCQDDEVVWLRNDRLS